jgi:hypothetical protein
VTRLVLVSPAGVPLERTLRAAALTFAAQVVRGCYPPRELPRLLGGVAAAPLAALRLAQAAHRLDLGPALPRVREDGSPCAVVACTRDRLVTPAHCRTLADALGAEYVEVDGRDGHIWPITEPDRLRALLAAA